jgi:hypothetical protein
MDGQFDAICSCGNCPTSPLYDLTFCTEQEAFGSGTPIAPAKKVTSFEIHWHKIYTVYTFFVIILDFY